MNDDPLEMVVDAIVTQRGGAGPPCFIVGIAGSQGSGKSTLCRRIESSLALRGLSVATLSIDDLYLPHADRQRLSEEVHPLLRTRGVPGTHDVALGHAVFDACSKPGQVRLPRFAKETDDRLPVDRWTMAQGPLDVLLFEGWCVGAAPQAEDELLRPVNSLEREQDGDGRWRRWVNGRLASDYAGLFGRIDWVLLLAAPGFEVVADWRREQEEQLRQRLKAEGRSIIGTMDDAEIGRFVQHYQRITEHVLREMPTRADLVITLDRQRRWLGRLSD